MYQPKEIKICSHCGWMGITKGNKLPEGISGLYCENCKTAKDRKELDKLQLAEFDKKACSC